MKNYIFKIIRKRRVLLPLILHILLTSFNISCIEFNRNTGREYQQTLSTNSCTFADSVLYCDKIPFPIPDLELPKSSTTDTIIRHSGFSLLYSNEHKQPLWVAYELTEEKSIGKYPRTNIFRPDPNISSGTATNDDYYKSGYDRGHLAPAADMGWSKQSMKESFYYSNISPQLPEFNRAIWNRLERLIRHWARVESVIYIATGPVLHSDLQFIGINRVSVPEYFYKVILDYTPPEIKGIGFILPNEGSDEPLKNYAVTIDSVERFTGIDFFYNLPDSIEIIVETSLCISCWDWTPTSKHSREYQSTQSVQCKGVTRSGVRCRNRTYNPEGYCNHHIEQYEKNNE